jgi:hypothetical protein
MKSAIPHLLRGYPAPNEPTGTVGWRIKRLEGLPRWQPYQDWEEKKALPPLSCLTMGLHYAAIRWRPVQEGDNAPEWATWRVRLMAKTLSGYPEDPGDGICYVAVYRRLQGELWCMGTIDWPLRDGQNQFFTDQEPFCVALGIQPTTGELNPRMNVEEAWIHNIGVGPVQYLNQAKDFKHWPRRFPSRKADAIPADLTWLTD